MLNIIPNYNLNHWQVILVVLLYQLSVGNEPIQQLFVLLGSFPEVFVELTENGEVIKVPLILNNLIVISQFVQPERQLEHAAPGI